MPRASLEWALLALPAYKAPRECKVQRELLACQVLLDQRVQLVLSASLVLLASVLLARRESSALAELPVLQALQAQLVSASAAQLVQWVFRGPLAWRVQQGLLES